MKLAGKALLLVLLLLLLCVSPTHANWFLELLGLAQDCANEFINHLADEIRELFQDPIGTAIECVVTVAEETLELAELLPLEMCGEEAFVTANATGAETTLALVLDTRDTDAILSEVECLAPDAEVIFRFVETFGPLVGKGLRKVGVGTFLAVCLIENAVKASNCSAASTPTRCAPYTAALLIASLASLLLVM